MIRMPRGDDSPAVNARSVCSIVPPFLLARIATLEDPQFEQAAHAARRSLAALVPDRLDHGRGGHAHALRGRVGGGSVRADDGDRRGILTRAISDAAGREELPGALVRAEGAPETGDAAVTEAYDGLGATFALFWAAFGRDSIDDRSCGLEATVHYGARYDNAFWDGERMVFGDGDGEVFVGFTRSLSVIGHELAHGVTEATAGLVYRGQSGALNEHVSDVFGALVEQYTRGQSTAEASWLIGEGIFTDAVEGNALRSLRAPGTAYDDDVLGRDPQPDHLDGYVSTEDDNGGVHLNSGIPNRAFWSVADTLGGNAWDRAGRIWYDTLTGGVLRPESDFAAFARATLASSDARYGADSNERRAVLAGWRLVGIDADG